MARLLLNTRASRITIVDKILLLPAEVRKDEQLGKVVLPSKTVISERGKPSPYSRVMGDRGTRRLLDAGILRWSDEKVEEPAEPAEEEPGPDSEEEEVDPEPETEPTPARLPSAAGVRKVKKRGQHQRERKAG
jgi:hypothetical protein